MYYLKMFVAKPLKYWIEVLMKINLIGKCGSEHCLGPPL